MNYKIEAWVQCSWVLIEALHNAQRLTYWEREKIKFFGSRLPERIAEEQTAKSNLEAHLRTTPEGFVLVPVEPTEAMLQAEIDAVSDYWFDHEELGNRTEATKIGYKAMLAASQESGTLRKVIDIAIKEQNKC